MLTIQASLKSLSVRQGGADLLGSIPIAIKALLLKEANEQLEADITALAASIKHGKDHPFAWVMTWYSPRVDDLEGIILWYYMLACLRYIKRQQHFSSIQFSGTIPDYACAWAAQSLQVSYRRTASKKADMRQRLRQYAAPLQTLTRILKNRNARIAATQGAIWVSGPANFARNRYKTSLSALHHMQKQVFMSSFVDSAHNLPAGHEALNFAGFFEFKDLSQTWRRAAKLKQSISNVKAHTLVSLFADQQPVTQIMIMMLRSTLIEKGIEALKPKAVFITTGTTYPPARMITQLAHQHHIPAVVVACRPMFTPLRPEERLTAIDLDATYHAHVADSFIVWDKFSATTLQASGFPANRIFTYKAATQQPSSDQSAAIRRPSSDNPAHGFLILFTHEVAMNESLLNSILKLPDQNLYIRTHPACKLTDAQSARLNSHFSTITDLSGIKLFELTFTDVVAITINTTAMVEVCSYGCGAVWLPYLNHRSVVFYPVMEVLGKALNNDEDLLDYYANTLSNETGRAALINSCVAAYSSYFEAPDTTPQLFKDLSIN